MDKTETYQDIMQKITSGLTGDPKRDLKYLVEQMEAYKDHPLGKEIIRECGRMSYDLLPDEARQEIASASSKDTDSISATLNEVHSLIAKKQPEKALSAITDLMKRIEEESRLMYQDDAVSEYRCFQEPMEEVLYKKRTGSQKEVRIPPTPFSMVFLTHGSILMELGRREEARESLAKGLRWNPSWFDLRTEYIESFKGPATLEEFFRLSLEAFQWAFRPRHLARCYRNLGFYFIEKKLYSEALAVYRLSCTYEPDSPMARNEILYIAQVTRGKAKHPTEEQVREYAKKYGFPIGPDMDVLDLALYGGIHYRKAGDPETSRYFLNLAYDLTESDDIRRLIDSDSLPTEQGEPS